MKKRILLYSFIFLLISLSIVVAEENPTQSKIDKGYQCLTDKVKDKCSSLSFEEQVFSLMALKLNECKDSLISNSQDSECWPKSKCTIKSTAQAVLALSELGTDTKKAEQWLLSQNTTPNDLIWYLQIESSDATTCKINYGSQHTIKIGLDKKISGGAGSCFSLDSEGGGYWLKISSSCYTKEFTISCDKSFLTNLLYKQKGSSTVYVSETTNSASAEGSTTEKINSLCFKQGSSCDYEGSLWASLILDKKGNDISGFIPYLITASENNEKYIPNSFLYYTTDFTDFYSNLILQQKNNYWDESGDKFYDTSVALLSLQKDNSAEKMNSIKWLLETQDKDGCWKGNIRNTAFILYSAFPKTSAIVTTQEDCEELGKFCMSSISCKEAGGDVLSNYDCSGAFVCCSKEKQLDTCESKGGSICNSNQECSGVSLEASDLETGQKCCSQGICRNIEVDEKNECENFGGICRTICNDNEESSSNKCDFSSDTCCIKETSSKKEGGSWLWIWILLILIFLVILGIIFREKLKMLWLRISSRNGKPSSPSRGIPPRFPPSVTTPQMISRPRTIIPSSPPKPIMPKKNKEFDDVLKKLKDMGNK